MNRNAFQLSALTVNGVMESPAAVPVGWADDDCDFVTPGQRRLLDRNEVMLDSLSNAIADASAAEVIVASQTLWNSKRLMHFLPEAVPPADVYISDEESVCFDWDSDPNYQLSIMVQRDARLAFAAYLNGDRFNGAMEFRPEGLPTEIAQLLDRWLQRSAASG